MVCMRKDSRAMQSFSAETSILTCPATHLKDQLLWASTTPIHQSQHPPRVISCLYSHFKSVRHNSSHKLWEANYCSGSNASRRLLPALRLSAEILVQSCTLDFGIGRICHFTSAPICSDMTAEQTSCHGPAFNTPKHPEALFLFSSCECAWRTLWYAEEMMTVNAPRCISFAKYIYILFLSRTQQEWLVWAK